MGLSELAKEIGEGLVSEFKLFSQNGEKLQLPSGAHMQTNGVIPAAFYEMITSGLERAYADGHRSGERDERRRLVEARLLEKLKNEMRAMDLIELESSDVYLCDG